MSFTLTSAKKYVRDLGERVVMTFLQATGGALVAGGVFDVTNVRNVSAWQAAAVGGVAAVLALIKGIVAKAVGKQDSASLDPVV